MKKIFGMKVLSVKTFRTDLVGRHCSGEHKASVEERQVCVTGPARPTLGTTARERPCCPRRRAFGSLGGGNTDMKTIFLK